MTASQTPAVTAYQKLEKRFARIAALGDAQGSLNWDTNTMMPKGSSESRAEASATLDVIRHELLTDPQVGEWLSEAKLQTSAQSTDKATADWQLRNIEMMKWHYTHATAVPAELVEAVSKSASRCEMTWREARAKSDFAMLLPSLSEVLRVQREMAQAKAAALGCSPYEALLDQCQRGTKKSEIDTLFADLGDFLPGFLGEALEHQRSRGPALALNGPFAIEAQRELGLKLMRAVGFDFDRGRLDVSIHPFCGGSTDDVRITTRYDENNFAQALMGVMHETGHALYEQGRPAAWKSQPVGATSDLGIHESQSLLVEMQVARGLPFLRFAAPMIRDAFKGEGAAWSAENLQRIFSHVEPGFIRVDADEVTYPAHVILRYELEQAMIAGDLQLKDLPGAWNERMKKLLGLEVPNDRLGCLQDIHWPGGGWGYFPSYTMGALTAAQLFEAASKATATSTSDLSESIERGDFTKLFGWLKENIHSRASSRNGRELITEATGRPLETVPFKAHLKRRYLGVGA